MYTRVNLRIRLFPFVISALFHCTALQTVENHNLLRNGEEGKLVKPLYNKGLIKLHIVILRNVQLELMLPSPLEHPMLSLTIARLKLARALVGE